MSAHTQPRVVAERYVRERVDGVWQVRDTVGSSVGLDAPLIVVYGPGARGAADAAAGAARLNKVNTSRPANEVRAWRTAHKLTQARLATLLGVKWLAVQRWEAGTRSVPPFLHLALRQLEHELASSTTTSTTT